MDTSLKQTPLYYGLFPLCPKKFSLIEKKNLYKLYAGSLIWTVDTKCRPQRAKSWYKLDLSITDALVTRCWHIVLSVSEYYYTNISVLLTHLQQEFWKLKYIIYMYRWSKLWKKRKMFAKLLIHSSSTAVLKIKIKYLESRCILHKQWLKKAVQKNITNHCILLLEWSQDKNIFKNYSNYCLLLF